MSTLKLLRKPAEQNMYTCYDINAGYGLPFSCSNDQMALRAFQYYCLTDEEGIMKAGDLELYKCGTFNRDTGEYKNIRLKLIERGKKYVQNSIQRKSKNVPASRQ